VDDYRAHSLALGSLGDDCDLSKARQHERDTRDADLEQCSTEELRLEAVASGVFRQMDRTY